MYDFTDEFVALGKRIVEVTTKIELGEQTRQRVFSFCLHARMVDLASGVAALLKSHDVAGIPHLVRGQLEAYAELRNLVGDAVYEKNMEAAHCAQVEQVLRAVIREEFDTNGLPDVVASHKISEDRLEELRAEGAPALNVVDRFRKAGLILEYYSVYSYLCSHSHNNLSALEERHVDRSREPHQLLIGLDDIDAEFALIIELSLKMPIDSLGVLLGGVEGPEAEEYQQLRSDFERTRRKWSYLVNPASHELEPDSQ